MRKQNPYLIGLAAAAVLFLLLLLIMGKEHWQQALTIEVLAGIVAFLLYRGKIKAIFTIPELRQKILLTLLFLAIYRIGFAIPLPFVDQSKMTAALGAGGALGNVLNFVSMFSGGNLSHATVFGLGIMPYISASLSSNSSPPSIRLWKNCKKKARADAKKSTNTPATPPC